LKARQHATFVSIFALGVSALGCGVWTRIIGGTTPAASPATSAVNGVAVTPAPSADEQPGGPALLATQNAASGSSAAESAPAAAPAPRTPRPAQAGDPYGEALGEAFRAYRNLGGGKNADVLPALAKADPKLYGLAIVTVEGTTYEVGASRDEFSIQAVSQPFTLARAIDTAGADVVRDRIGVNATGQRRDSILAIDLAKNLPADRERVRPAGNPLVDAGAIATVDLVAAAAGMDKWTTLLNSLGAFAGRQLAVNQDLYRAETESNTHERAIAALLHHYAVVRGSPEEALDLYTRLGAISVTARDLAAMGATLANGGRNPLTGAVVVSPATAAKVLAVASTAGLHESSGEWLYMVGVPAKSGAGGGIVAVVPGRYAIGAFSPPLDDAGNSVRGQRAVASIVGRLGGNLFSVQPSTGGRRAEAPAPDGASVATKAEPKK